MLRASEGDVHEQGVSAGVQVQSERGEGGVGVPGADGLEDGRVSVGERDEVYVGLRSNLADAQLGFAHYGLVHASQARAPGGRYQCPVQSYGVPAVFLANRAIDMGAQSVPVVPGQRCERARGGNHLYGQGDSTSRRSV